ncbi:Down syndrome cell adhesion molecule-like protein 1 homolog isoform X3 [Varroa jacobsoni]|uniref:Down syndrome cell adhesion molecule-like protein 1 homolog isoform X3 n=1 Tax=Varroa jacobsoni TaxID=62625 RepID=UPI000BF2D41B|nr:Down syndrome cell adhesion molecule-like protein 1 homolog isoform X3 [Varroa jacobsoni]
MKWLHIVRFALQCVLTTICGASKIVPFAFPDNLQLGSSIDVVCSVPSNAHKLAWFKGNIEIKNGWREISIQQPTKRLLTMSIDAITLDHVGNYSCRALFFDDTEDWYSDELIVRAAPSWRVEPPSKVQIQSSSGGILNCQAEGSPRPHHSWENDKGQLVHNGSSLSIPARSDLQSGGGTHNFEVTCVADNGIGPSIRKTVYVTISGLPSIPTFAIPEKNSLGSEIKITCFSAGATSLSLFKNGVALQKGQRGTEITRMGGLLILSIEKLHVEHAGNYTCVAYNQEGSKSSSAFLAVIAPPTWITVPQSQVLTKQASASLECQADGFPQPNISWTKNGDIIGNVGILRFDEVDASDAGAYVCIARNDYGVIQHSIDVSVFLPPKFGEKHSVVSARRGENVKLTCEVQGDTPLHIKWSKGNRLIDKKPNNRYEIYETYSEQSMRSELFITTTERTDGAIYTCLAQNEHGNDDRTVKLLILEVPQPPRDVKVSETWSRSASISWTAPYTGNSPITRYTVQYWRVAQSHRLEELEVVGTQTSVLLSDLRPGIAYQVAVVADNAVGSSQPSSTITFTTGEEEPSEVPTDFHVEPKGPHTIRVSWKPPPREEWNGQLKGYYIGYKPSGHGQPHSFKTAEYKENSTNEFFLTGLQKATDYSVVVKAFNGAGVGRQTPDLHVKTLEGDVPPPPRVFVGATGISTITIQWVQAPQSGAKGFILYYRPDSDLNLGWRETQLDGRANQYTLQHLIAGTLYQIYVSATNEFGVGDPSEIISMRTHKSLASDVTSLLSTALFGESGNQSALLNFFVLVPVLASLVTIIVVIIVTCVCLHRIKARHERTMLTGQAIPLDPKTYMTIARSRMASMDGTCDGNPPMQNIVRTLPAGCVQTFDGKQLSGTGQPSPKQLPQPEYGQRYVDIQQPPPLPPDHPAGPPQSPLPVPPMPQSLSNAGITQMDDVEALKKQQHVNEEMKTFLMNHNGLPGMMQMPLQAQQSPAC